MRQSNFSYWTLLRPKYWASAVRTLTMAVIASHDAASRIKRAVMEAPSLELRMVRRTSRMNCLYRSQPQGGQGVCRRLDGCCVVALRRNDFLLIVGDASGSS